VEAGVTCRIHEREPDKGPLSPMKVLNAMFLWWADSYEDEALRKYYEQGMEFYESITQYAETQKEIQANAK
jgi:hypothetical protein